MNKEVRQYAEEFKSELLAYEQLKPAEFIKKYIDSDYAGDSEEEDVLIHEYFDCLEILHFKNGESGYNYFEITLGYG